MSKKIPVNPLLAFIKKHFPLFYREMRRQESMKNRLYKANLKRKEEQNTKHQEYLDWIEQRRLKELEILNKKGEKALKLWRTKHPRKEYNVVW